MLRRAFIIRPPAPAAQAQWQAHARCCSTATKKAQIAAALQNFSFELTPATAKKLLAPDADLASKPAKAAVLKQLQELAADQAEGKSCNRVYITKLPGHPQQDTIDAVNLVRDFSEGRFTLVPHIPARGIKDAEDLDQFLEKLDVKDVLVVGGSVDRPVGQFSESQQLLDTGVLQKRGIRTLGLAAHPQGADNIKPAVLQQAFVQKLRWAKRELQAGNFADIYWATQLAYSTEAIRGWETAIREAPEGGDVAQDANTLNINLGVPGPATTAQLVKYAQMSGIGNSINFFMNNPVQAWSLLTKRSVLDDLVGDTAEYMATHGGQQKIAGIHFFTFGALTKTLNWALMARAGRFDLDGNGKIRIHGET